jgi:two-component system LytT family response regulator
MQQAVLRMQAIISETLFLARSRMQRLPFDPGPFDLREFCAQLAADHEESPRLQFQCPPGPFPIVADALRLRQALENLLSNALKYSDGPVVLSLAAAPSSYLIKVRDEGIGIPAAEIADIFEPFFRASNTGARPGHGLGLSIVKSCIEQHGGSVRFATELNRGTTFSLELPKSAAPLEPGAARGAEPLRAALPPTPPNAVTASPAPPHLTEGAPVSAPRPAGKLTGIIVDDDPLVRGLLRDLLESELAIIGEAGTLAQARLLARQHRPDVVFLDVGLPDGSGFELLSELKPGVSAVFVTSAEEYAVNAFDCDAVDYLLKPVSPERLQKALLRVRHRLGGKAAPPPPATPPQGDTFLVKTLTERRLVKFSDIRRIIAYGEYSWVYWDKSKHGTLLRKSLKQWLSELPSEQFIRVHRGAIVNLAYLDRVERLSAGQLQVHLRDTAEPIPVSLRLAPTLNRKLKALRG